MNIDGYQGGEDDIKFHYLLNENKRIYTIPIGHISIDEIDEYIKVEIPEAESLLLEEGKPILPVITKIFTYPIGTIINDVNVEYNVEEKILTKKIHPSPKPAVLSSIEIQGASSEPTINQDVYQSTDMYPITTPWQSSKIAMVCRLSGNHDSSQGGRDE